MTLNSSSPWSFVRLLGGVAAVVVLLAWFGGWALPVVVGAIILMVMGHEFGHFITAKRSGMQVTDFFVGFGPVVWSFTRGETRYGVRAFLLGGYVKVPGMSWSETVDPALESRTYRSASYPRKVLFASAGSLMHLVMALLLAWASLALVGLPSASAVGIAGFTKWSGHAENAAQLGGLRVGDRVVSVDGRSVGDATTLVHEVHDHVGSPLTLVVLRQGRDVTVHVTPVDGRTLKVAGAPLAAGPTPQGFIGVMLAPQVVRSSIFGAVPSALHQVSTTVTASLHSMVHVFSPGEFVSLFHQVQSPAVAANPAVQATRPQSIVGVVRVAVQGAHAGVGTLLVILMAVNIFVGVLNMLPMLPLDGGHVAVATYERLRSRRGRHYHADINRLAPVAYAFMSVLVVLFAFTLYLDIVHPITNPFR